MEYKFKQMDIFKPFISVLEYATYDALKGNWTCAYLSLLPIVEAVLRKWGEMNPELSFERIKQSIPAWKNHFKSRSLQLESNENLKKCIDSEIDYFGYIMDEVCYLRFNDYKNKNFSEVFNRNLSLHKLEGVLNPSERMHNVCRILLLIDIIAELYSLENYNYYWCLSFNADYDKDLDFILRWELYKKWAMLSIGPDDLLLIQNCFLDDIDDEIKKQQIEVTKKQIKLIMRR